MAITTEQLVAASAKYLQDNLTVVTTIVFPGMRVDTGSINDWIELWLFNARQKKRRRTGKDRYRVALQVHCFVKRTTNIYRIMDIVKDVADQLEHAEISVKDYDLSGSPEVGWLRLYEPTRRDNSKEATSQSGSNLKSIILEFPAFAQEI